MAKIIEADFEDAAEDTTVFQVGSKTYEIRITKQRLDLYEQRNTPVMASFMNNNGALTRAELVTLVGYSLREEGGPFVNPRRGIEMAEALMEENGYAALLTEAFKALQRDCGFLFQ